MYKGAGTVFFIPEEGVGLAALLPFIERLKRARNRRNIRRFLPHSPILATIAGEKEFDGHSRHFEIVREGLAKVGRWHGTSANHLGLLVP